MCHVVLTTHKLCVASVCKCVYECEYVCVSVCVCDSACVRLLLFVLLDVESNRLSEGKSVCACKCVPCNT